MPTRTLLMVFLNEFGKKVNIRIPYAKEDITKQEVAGVMDTIINANVIVSDSCSLIKKSSARVTTQEIKEINL